MGSDVRKVRDEVTEANGEDTFNGEYPSTDPMNRGVNITRDVVFGLLDGSDATIDGIVGMGPGADIHKHGEIL